MVTGPGAPYHVWESSPTGPDMRLTCGADDRPVRTARSCGAEKQGAWQYSSTLSRKVACTDESTTT